MAARLLAAVAVIACFEDIFAAGMMRYGVLFVGGDTNHHNIMRRVVVRWDYSTTAQPRASIVVYGGAQEPIRLQIY